MPELIDTHSHIQFSAYDSDREGVILRAKNAGVRMIAIGTNLGTSLEAISATEKFKDTVLGATVGFHPGHLAENQHHDKNELREKITEKFDIEKLHETARHPNVVAIGECGLDYYRIEQIANSKLQIERQKEAFIEQVKLAYELKKPLAIHCRSAFSDLLDLLFANRHLLLATPGVIHFFSGTLEEAQALIDMGFYIAFGGVITFVNDYDEVVKNVTLEKIVLETDAPYVAPAPYRGKRNEPSYILEVAKKIAAIKNIDLEIVAKQTTENARRLFNLI